MHGLLATFRSTPGNNGNQHRHGTVPCKTVDCMHTGQQYHEFMLASKRDRRVRRKFQEMALDLLPAGTEVLDFGAGTGIDAKVFAASGHPTFVYEPSAAMRTQLARYCQAEIGCNAVVVLSRPLIHKVQAVTANFAVFNHFEDHTLLFEKLAHVVHPGGFVLASMLSPFYLGDARYGWWRRSLGRLVKTGHYPSPGESRIHRFAPRVVARAAAPHFRLERLLPRGFGLTMQLYMFLLFRRV